MPIYFVKRYHKAMPSNDEVWHLGREIAFEASDEGHAISRAKEIGGSNNAPYAGLIVVTDLAGKCLIDVRLDNMMGANNGKWTET